MGHGGDGDALGGEGGGVEQEIRALTFNQQATGLPCDRVKIEARCIEWFKAEGTEVVKVTRTAGPRECDARGHAAVEKIQDHVAAVGGGNQGQAWRLGEGLMEQSVGHAVLLS
jgi:hypothetical protein